MEGRGEPRRVEEAAEGRGGRALEAALLVGPSGPRPLGEE